MSSKRNYFENLEKPYRTVFLRQKQFAFLTTAAAFFCLLCFVSSLYMKEFETISYVDISASGENPQQLFESAIAKEIASERMREHVEFAATQMGGQENIDLPNIDFELLRESFDFKIAPNRARQQFRLSASYTGTGAKAEQLLTDAVIRSVAERLGAVNNMANALSEFDDKYELVQNSIENNAQQFHNELGDANELVNELNNQLSDVHEAVQLIRPDERESPESLAQGDIEEDRLDSLLVSLVNQLEQFSRSSVQEEKQQIGRSIAKINDQLKAMNLPSSGEAGTSMRIINASLPESNSATRSILALLENLDTDTIHARIGQVQSNLRAGTVQLREEVSELRSLTNRFSESRFVVNGISQARTRPAASAPSIGHVFLFGLVAVIAASVVATYYRPEQENCGFESVDSVHESLEIPVISEIAGDGPSGSRSEAWGNKVVRYCEVGLFGFVLLAAILCFIQPEIRTAFFESPFYGMSKIANLFF